MNRDRLSNFACEMDFQNQKLLTSTEHIWGKGHRKTAVYMWYKRFVEGRENIKDDQPSGPPSVVTSSHLAAVKQLLNNGRPSPSGILLQKLTTVTVQCQVLFINQLNMCRICARWIPKMLNTRAREIVGFAGFGPIFETENRFISRQDAKKSVHKTLSQDFAIHRLTLSPVKIVHT